MFCFEKTYGKIELRAINALYYGDHKAYLAGGMFSIQTGLGRFFCSILG
jgi:hypothetical protein